MESKRKRSSAFDVIRAIACFSVVLIHYNLNGDLGEALKAAARFSVPIFFIISGYFLSSAERQIKKLFRLLLSSMLFYCVFDYVFVALNLGSIHSISTVFFDKYLTAAQITRFFVSNSTLFAPHLWFISALIYCYIFVVLFLDTERKLVLSCYFIVPLLIVLAVTQEFSKILAIKWHLHPIYGVIGKEYIAVSALFMIRALPFFLIGVWLRHSRLLVNFKLGLVFLIVAITGSAISIGEYFILGHRVAGFYIGSTITAVALVLWAMNTNTGGWMLKMLSWVGRELSTYIYIYHIAVGRFVLYMVDKSSLRHAIWVEYILFFVVLLLSIFVSLGIRALKARFVK